VFVLDELVLHHLLQRGLPEADDAGQAHRAQTLHRQARPRHAGNPQLEVEQSQMNAQEVIAAARTLIAGPGSFGVGSRKQATNA